MNLRSRYRAWAFDVPEGALRKDWRFHPLANYRNARYTTELPSSVCARRAIRLLFGFRPYPRPRTFIWGATAGPRFRPLPTPRDARFEERVEAEVTRTLDGIFNRLREKAR